MCRLFPVELIESIKAGHPILPGAIDVVAKHMSGDWRAAGAALDLTRAVDALARAAVLGSIVGAVNAAS
jgi:hypothetical protein